MSTITFSGLNSSKEKVDKFSSNFDEENLNNIITNFDSILHLNKNDNRITLSNFDFNKNEFRKLDLAELNKNDVQSISTNTDYIWLSNRFNQLLQLKRPFDKVNKLIQLSLNDYNHDLDGDVLLCVTDVNLYLLCRKSSKCIFQLENDSGKVAKINESSVMAIPLNQKFFNEKIKEISCGREHVLILAEPSGLVYSFGIGTRGQLGQGTIDNSYEPKLIENFKNVKQIACGGWHSALIDQDGNLYMWGWNSNGQLGIYDDEDEREAIISVPTLVSISDDFGTNIKFKKVSLGSRHSLFLDNNNNVYSVGWNKYKQSILDTDDEDVKAPVLVESSVKDIKAGPWYSLILS